MALIQLQTAAQTPAERTKAQIEQSLRSGYIGLKASFNLIKRLVWQNRDLTPQQAFDLFGADAAQLCAISDATKNLLAAAGEDVGPICPPDKTLTINANGTVTVS